MPSRTAGGGPPGKLPRPIHKRPLMWPRGGDVSCHCQRCGHSARCGWLLFLRICARAHGHAGPAGRRRLRVASIRIDDPTELESLSVWAGEEDLELNKSGTWPARHAFFFIPGFSIGSQASSWKCAWPKLILFPRRRQENVYYFNSRACSRKKNVVRTGATTICCSEPGKWSKLLQRF